MITKLLKNRCLYLLLCWLLFEVVDCHNTLKVQLYHYYNPLNLEYRSDMANTPYCCCNTNDCHSNIGNFTRDTCKAVHCSLKITLCIHSGFSESVTRPATKTLTCHISELFSAPFKYDFLLESTVFPDLPKTPSEIIFQLDRFTDDITLTVSLEEQDERGFQTVDVITIPIAVCNLSKPAQAYQGVHGIASLKLGYAMDITADNYRKLCLQPITVAETITQTITFTPPSFTMVKETEMATPSSAFDGAAVTSWMPATITLLAILAVFVPLLAIIIASALYLRLRKKSKSGVQVAKEPQVYAVPCDNYLSPNRHRDEHGLYAVPSRITINVPDSGPLYSDVGSPRKQQSHHYFELTTPTQPKNGGLQQPHHYFELNPPTRSETVHFRNSM